MGFTSAIALLEFGSIAAGIEAGDAMVKRAALDVIRAGTVQPGRYLVLIGGTVADLEEALDAAMRVGAATITAADAGLKGAAVTLREIFLADGLGGKGYLLFQGPVVEVEAAVEIGVERAPGRLVGSRVIAQLHEEMDENLAAHGHFGVRVRGG